LPISNFPLPILSRQSNRRPLDEANGQSEIGNRK
jgi:hypothetical protein